MYGREVWAPIDLLMRRPNEKEYIYPDELVVEIRAAQEQACLLAGDQLRKATERNKKNYT